MSTFISGMNYDLLKDDENMKFISATAYYGYKASEHMPNPIQHLQACMMVGMTSEVINEFCKEFDGFDYYQFFKNTDHNLVVKLIIMGEDAWRNFLIDVENLTPSETPTFIKNYFDEKYNDENPEIDEDISREVDKMVEDIENGKDIDDVIDNAESESEEDE